MTKPLTLTVQEIHDQEIIAKTSDGQLWRLPSNSLHGKPTVGGDLRGFFFTPDTDGLKESGLAHQLINELLNPSRP
jgi:hypothetical protein